MPARYATTYIYSPLTGWLAQRFAQRFANIRQSLRKHSIFAQGFHTFTMVSKDWHVRAKIGKYGANLLSGKTPLSKDSISEQRLESLRND